MNRNSHHQATNASHRQSRKSAVTQLLAGICLLQLTAANANAYDLGTVVADMRQSAAQSGPTSCPQYTRFDVSTPGAINRQWSTALGASPVTILTSSQTSAGRLNEVESVINTSLAVWTGVSGTLLTPSSLGALQRTPAEAACSSSDGINSICFDQNDPAFTLGVLAFTRVVSADTIGEQLSPATPPSTFVGEILDADVLVASGNAGITFATPAALAANPSAYDLESILTHELGHSFGFDHSGAWNTMMFPYAPPAGQFTAPRPTSQAPDAPLSDDDRTGLRVLYPDPSDAVHVGAIGGHVLPANPLALPLSPYGVTGIFPAQVTALDSSTGAVIVAALGGWSCTDPGPVQFDGTYALQRLAVGSAQTYQIYAEPLDGLVDLGNVISNLASLCRNSATDPGWPAQYACVVPASAAPFSARIRPGP
jgi:Matrixin